MLYFWLDSPETAFKRVAKRVTEGGHNIPKDIIKRRYYRGISNLIKLYIPVCDECRKVNNMDLQPKVVALFQTGLGKSIIISDIWKTILTQSNNQTY